MKKKNKYEKLHSIVTQLMLVAAYPVVFHLAAFLGSSNQHKDQPLGNLAFPLISLMIWVGLFIATVCTWLIKRHVKPEESNASVDNITAKRDKTKNWIVFTSLIIASLLIRLPMLGTFQRWDAGEYF